MSTAIEGISLFTEDCLVHLTSLFAVDTSTLVSGGSIFIDDFLHVENDLKNLSAKAMGRPRVNGLREV